MNHQPSKQRSQPTMHDVCMEVSNVFILAALSQIFLSSYAGKRNRAFEICNKNIGIHIEK